MARTIPRRPARTPRATPVNGGRPVTLFTGQWADLPLEELCRKVNSFGYEGVELACWGDHFDVSKALDGKAGVTYLKKKWQTLEKHGLACYAVSAHLVGQAVCDLIDARHQQILPGHVWGDGDPEDGVRLVGVGVRGDPGVGLGGTAHVAERGGAVVTGPGVDARQIDHGADSSQASASGSGRVPTVTGPSRVTLASSGAIRCLRGGNGR